MADEQRRRTGDKLSVPIWVLITFVLSVLVGGAGWIESGLKARQDSTTIQNAQEIRQLQNEQDQQNAIITSTVDKVSALTVAMAVQTENAKRLDRIEALVTQILQRVR